MQKIIPYLWFDDQAEEAARFYVSVFKNSRITNVQRYGDAVPGQMGKVMVVTFQLEGQDFVALNGGPQFKFTEAISLFVDCKDQAEVDDLWGKLTADGGEESMCGWLKDKYGLSWQIVPAEFMEMARGDDPVRTDRVMKAMLEMRKLDVAELRRAYEGRSAP